MYRRIEDFTNDWKYERESTLKLFRNVTDGSLSQRINPQGRELGRLAFHITESLTEMLHRAGLAMTGKEDLGSPAHAADIVSLYDRISQEVLDLVPANWTDAALTEEVEMYGQKWTKGTVLSILVLHQAHHRGQLTVLMRQAGLAVPGVYGPAREEWAAMGIPAAA